MERELLLTHFRRYPRMTPTDAVKLIYQSVYGGGHLIRDPEKALAFLHTEREQLRVMQDVPLCEAIGGGMVRINLAAPDCAEIPDSILFRTFAASAARVSARGSVSAFERALELLTALAEEGLTPFSPEALSEYLTAYRAEGCPPVSHSKEYRAAYTPAYRILEAVFPPLFPVIAAIDRLLEDSGKPTLTVAIDGPAASGKTTAAAALASLYDCNVFHMDDYFLPFALRTEERLAEPGGNVHYERVQEEILSGIAAGAVTCRPFDCHTGTLRDAVTYPVKRLNLVEGSYAHHPYFGDAYDLRICLTVPGDEQRRRILARSGEAMLRMFETRWIPMENRYFTAFQIPAKADYLIKTETERTLSPDDYL